MNCFVRASKYLYRKKRKAILLLLFFLAINVMVSQAAGGYVRHTGGDVWRACRDKYDGLYVPKTERND